MGRWVRASGWGLVALAVAAAAVVVIVGAFRARHSTTDFNVWVGWATVIAVPLAALGLVLVLWDKITGHAGTRRKSRGGGDAWRVIPVAECSPHDVRVHMAAEFTASLPPYVSRQHDGLLQARLRSASLQGGFVVVTGGSAVGKSRSLLEAVREVLGGWHILLPVSPAAVREAAAGGHIRPRTLLWLDDTPAEKYITATADGLTSDDIRAVFSSRKPVVVVDSMWQTRYQSLIAQPRLSPGESSRKDPSREARDALLLAGEPILVKDHFTDDERLRAKILAQHDQQLTAALADTRFGVTQSLAGARYLVRRYRDAENDMPFAYAVITAAIDACRLGSSGPFTQTFLRAAAFGYLGSREQAAIADGHPGSRPGWFSDALVYAADTEVNPGHVAPLVPTLLDGNLAHGVGYSVADYLLQYMLRERRHVQVPAVTWDALLKFADVPADLARWLFEHGRMDELRQRADAGDVRARELLADWLAQEDEIPELRRRAEAGDDSARRLLAGWLSERDRVDEAIEAIGPLADAGDDSARRLLAGWLLERDRVDEAIEAIGPLADAGDDSARRLLAGWLLEAKRIVELEHRARTGDRAARSMMARWQHDQGRVDEAIATIRPLAVAGDAAASHLLARWQHDQGTVDEAIATIGPLAVAGDAAARRLLADWLYRHERIDELRQRAGTGDDEARSRLARWLLEHDHITELRQRTESGDEHAGLLLADWMFEQKGLDELRQRARAGEPHAGARLAIRLYEKDHVDQAITEIRPLADAGDDSARHLLAAWLSERDAIDELTDRADRGDNHAEVQLVSWLLNHAREKELRQRIRRSDDPARIRLTLSMANWMYERNRADDAITAIRPLAAAGNENAAQTLSIWLAERHKTV